MRLETTRFGVLEISDEQVITFTQPIIGFQQLRRFVIVPGPEGSVVKWLQSTESVDTAFLIMDPRPLMPSYELDLRQEELTELAVENASALDIYTLVVVPQDPTQIRTNLKAPIVINPKMRLGKQTILERKDYPIQFYLARQQQGAEGPQEVMHARSDT